ncbi:MAG: hypothetical protein ACRDBG_25910 [Waterburya sp.]
MEDWKTIREDIFEEQFDNERSPDNGGLRELSPRYLAWKRANYPGRKKRVLTGRTRESHKVFVSRDRIVETVSEKAVLLQEYMDLPVLPSEFTNPTSAALMKATIEYLANY